MTTLNLTIKKKWYDMIISGEKKEEYREIKPYWVSRLTKKHSGCIGGDLMDRHNNNSYTFKKFDAIKFTNGYNKDSPSFLIELKSISTCSGISQWGANGNDVYFTFKLGQIINE